MLVEICLPMKNEAEIVKANLLKILDFCQQANFPFTWKIIGISNASTDSTVQILSALKQAHPEYIDYVESSLPGRGRALKNYWSMSQADILAYLDSDLAVLPEQLPALILPIFNNEADMVIGSRLIRGANVERSKKREYISRIFNGLTRLIMATRVSDFQCGFKAIRATTFKKILPHLRDDYWYFDSELIILCKYFSFRLQEIPVNWVENRFQKRASKVKVIRDIIKFIKDIIFFRWRLFFIPKLK